MSATKKILALDLGAESGRAILGRFDGARLAFDTVHRFPNGPVRLLDNLYWNALGLFSEMVAGLRKTAAEHGGVDSLGIDTWGVDFAFLGKDDALLGNPRHYRDPHTEAILDQAFARVPRAAIYQATGIQFMRFNSLFQLLAMQRDGSPLLDAAKSFLMVPDLFHFFFTGVIANEFSDVTTSQMYDPTARGWATDLLKRFGLPIDMLGTIVRPGTRLGTIRPSVAKDAGVAAVPVVLPATHDTGSAVAAVPARTASWAYISSGTWSLMGVELPGPLISEATLAANFTNEGGVGGTIRFLKNIMGLWLVQECRRAWERDGMSFTYDELVKLSAAAPPFVSIVDPDDASFYLPASMPAAIADFCRKRNQPAPADPGACVRCCLESLACRYRWVLEKLEELTGRRLEVIHIVGGGCQNTLLCQLAADCCNRPVVAGPVEATAIGNILVQALGLGLIGSLEQGREVVRQSFDVKTYEPKEPELWRGAYERFVGLVKSA